MTLPSRFWFLSPVLALLAGSPIVAGEFTSTEGALTQNQHIANTIARHLERSGQLRNYSVDVLFQAGTAQLSGAVCGQAQRRLVLQLAREVPGVTQVDDRLTIRPAIRPVGGTITPKKLPTLPAPEEDSAPPAIDTGREAGGSASGGLSGQPTEIKPIFQAPAPSPYALNPPKMPPYAWPSYAPYNNYSRVAYPEAYPYQAWPFIGPIYPFPKVPLGWRSVKLEWDDGYWWFSKVGNKHDWWKLRYH